jgi:diguanylate cyclase (GGDEF)-like protein
MRLLDSEEKPLHFFTRIEEHSIKDTIHIFLVCADDILESEKYFRKKLSVRNAVLGLYNDISFEYTPSDNRMKIYSIGKNEENADRISLEEFEYRMLHNARTEWLDDIHEFLKNIREGARNFGIQVDGRLLTDDEHVRVTVMNGTTIYENGIAVMVTGYIHFGVEYSQNARKKLEVDSLTGLLAKSEITNIAIRYIDIRKIKDIAIAIVDVDYFKRVNDTYGHMYGDEVLKKVAAIMEKQVADNGLVGRIGGDEFFIIFYHVYDMENMRERLRSIKNTVLASFPHDEDGKPFITLSIGCASYPKDADNYEDLFKLADFALYRAKEKGRNRYIIYDKEKHGALEKIKNMQMSGERINGRGDMALGDILCAIMDKVYSEKEYPLDKLLDDIVVNFGIQRIMVYAGQPYRVVSMAGEKRPSEELILQTEAYMDDAGFQKRYDHTGCLIIDDIKYLKGKQEDIYTLLCRQDVLSFIQLRFSDKNGNPAVLSLESVNQRVTWNRSSLHYYRLLARLLSEYVLL